MRGSHRIRTYLRYMIICFILIQSTCVVQASYTQAEQGNDPAELREWNRMNSLIEEALALVQKEEFEAGRQLLQAVSDQFMKLSIRDYVESLEQAQVLMHVLLQAKHALAELQPSTEQVTQSMLRLRLTFDAVSHQRQPLWLHYYPRIQKTLEDMKHVMEINDKDNYYVSLNRLSGQFEMVRPAIVISHSAGVAEAIDSHLHYIHSEKNMLWSNKDQLLENIDSLDFQFRRAFFQQDKANTQSFWSVFLLIMGSIVSVLSYVAWKKYKAEERKSLRTKDRSKHE